MAVVSVHGIRHKRTTGRTDDKPINHHVTIDKAVPMPAVDPSGPVSSVVAL
jgi:hypothetical protein